MNNCTKLESNLTLFCPEYWSNPFIIPCCQNIVDDRSLPGYPYDANESTVTVKMDIIAFIMVIMIVVLAACLLGLLIGVSLGQLLRKEKLQPSTNQSDNNSLNNLFVIDSE